MKKITIFILSFLLFIPNIHANIRCNDGTTSPSCADCHQGCCSHHGGCATSSNQQVTIKSKKETLQKSKNTYTQKSTNNTSSNNTNEDNVNYNKEDTNNIRDNKNSNNNNANNNYIYEETEHNVNDSSVLEFINSIIAVPIIAGTVTAIIMIFKRKK